jgi:hypothetical protein
VIKFRFSIREIQRHMNRQIKLLGEAHQFWTELVGQVSDTAGAEEEDSGSAAAGSRPEASSGPVKLFTILVGIFQKDLEIWWKHERTKVGHFPPLLHFVLGKYEACLRNLYL